MRKGSYTTVNVLGVISGVSEFNIYGFLPVWFKWIWDWGTSWILTVVRKDLQWFIKWELYSLTCEKNWFHLPSSSVNSLGLWCRTKEVLGHEEHEKDAKRYFCPGQVGTKRMKLPDWLCITFISFKRVFKSYCQNSIS